MTAVVAVMEAGLVRGALRVVLNGGKAGITRMWLRAGVIAVWVCTMPAYGQSPERQPVRPYNLSSHLPEFFRDLLGGRTWVFETRGSPAALFFGPNGSVEACRLGRNGKFMRTPPGARWRIGTRNGASNLDLSWATSEGIQHFRMVIVYEPKTGRFHGERFSTSERKWHIARDGWVQEGWPAGLVDACPGVRVPWDVKIEERQKGLGWEEVKANAVRVMNHPGSEVRFPGATGLGASGGKPTLTLQEVNAARWASHGFVSIDMSGEKRVSVVWPQYSEVWWLDENDDVVDVGITEIVGDGSVVVVRWEKSGHSNTYHLGYPLPLIPTERRHPAFVMMGDVVERGEEVVLNRGGEGALAVLFRDLGRVESAKGSGKWWLSRGAVYVKIGDNRDIYPWRDFAVWARWSGNGG